MLAQRQHGCRTPQVQMNPARLKNKDVSACGVLCLGIHQHFSGSRFEWASNNIAKTLPHPGTCVLVGCIRSGLILEDTDTGDLITANIHKIIRHKPCGSLHLWDKLLLDPLGDFMRLSGEH